ncbi:MAG: hypothetical protein AAFZ07_03965 [Actinomycetota bacterium]
MGAQMTLSSRHRPLRHERPELTSQALLGALADTRRGEYLLVQWLLVRPLQPELVSNQVSQEVLQTWPQALIGASLGQHGRADPAMARALRDKRNDVGWQVIGRIVVRSASTGRSRQLVAGVLAALRTTAGPGVIWHARSIRPTAAVNLRTWVLGRTSLNLSELLAVTSWPIGPTSSLPVQSRQSRALPPSPAIVDDQRTVGVSTVPPERGVSLRSRDSLMHLAVTAPTGTGKSTLLMQLALQDAAAGRGLVVIDPKGGLIDDLLARLPEGRHDDVVVVDPMSDHPVGLNPLETRHRSPEAVADQLLVVFRNLFAGHWGPRTQDILHAALLTLARVPGTTLAALPLLLTDDAFRRRLVGKIDDPFGVSAFWSTFETWSPAERSTNIGPSLTRLRPFLMRPPLRRMLAQAEPRWSISELFTKRKIVLVDLSHADLGADGANLLGSLFVAELWQATLQRGRIPAERRHPVSVTADEFQDYCHFASDFEAALTKSRSFGVGWTLAHQHLDQLPAHVRAAVQANARSKILFQLSAEDARAFTRHDPILTAADLQSLPAYEAYARLVADGAVQPWCSIRTLPPEEAVHDPQRLRRVSADRYGRDRKEIDAELTELLGRSRPPLTDDLAPRTRPRKGPA